MKYTITALLTTLISVSLQTAIAAEAVLVGGGYDVHSSQAQIELNVKWVQGILDDKGIPTSIFFTDADETGPDVHYQAPPEQVTPVFEPLSRVFGNWILHARRYREHNVVNVSGSTRRDDLVPALRDVVDATADTDLLFVYNGHGRQSPSTPDLVTLNLWENTTLTANELHSIVKKRSAPFRYVFTQCFSGGFHRLAYQDPSHGLEVSKSPRCGFTAESAYRLAEGCSASVEIDDYRDYSTYFFAALSGNERDGAVISRNPDTNDDGVTTFREAHFFTLEDAYSTDLSRSSSEDYLTQWQPWYLRWLPPSTTLPNNEYAQLFRDLANRHNIPLTGMPAKHIRRLRAETQLLVDDTRLQRQNLQHKERELQFILQSSLSSVWPDLLGPYTGAYQKMAANGQLTTISASVSEHKDYASLVEVQERKNALDTTLLDLERKTTQYQKLFRLRQLAVLKQHLLDYGSASELADYTSLVNCEEAPL